MAVLTFIQRQGKKFCDKLFCPALVQTPELEEERPEDDVNTNRVMDFAKFTVAIMGSIAISFFLEDQKILTANVLFKK